MLLRIPVAVNRTSNGVELEGMRKAAPVALRHGFQSGNSEKCPFLWAFPQAKAENPHKNRAKRFSMLAFVL
jgi:hypothetical protein